MKRLLVVSMLVALPAHGEEEAPRASPMREKIRARIIETLPPPPAPGSEETTPPNANDELIDLEPLVVIDSPVLRDLAAKIQSESGRIKSGRFDPVKGGTIYKRGNLEMGSWSNPLGGVTLMNIRF